MQAHIAYLIETAINYSNQEGYSVVGANLGSLLSTASDQNFEAIPAASPP